MSSHYSIKNGQKYFYYKCTRVMHRDKKACPSKPLGSREFENAIVEKIKGLSQDRSQLEETLQNANLVAQKELEPLRERKILLENAKREKEEEIKRLIKAIKVGNLEIEAIEKELKSLEEEKKSLERQIEELNIYIRREESKLIDIDIVHRTYQGFSQVFPNLPPKEKHQLLQLIIKELVVFEDRVKVSFYEIPELALSIQNTKGLCEPTKWLQN
jgi:DNA repair exonuclease SbcCD ATPase subunit